MAPGKVLLPIGIVNGEISAAHRGAHICIFSCGECDSVVLSVCVVADEPGVEGVSFAGNVSGDQGIAERLFAG